MKTKVIKFDPREGYGKHITGESGCVNCGHKIVYGEPFTMDWNHYGSCVLPSGNIKESWGKYCYWIPKDEECGCTTPQPRKAQTIRDKPIEVGQKVNLWEMWRGMKKGLYCPMCWNRYSPKDLQPCKTGESDTVWCSKCQRHDAIDYLLTYPRKLLETTIGASIGIRMRYDEERKVLLVEVNPMFGKRHSEKSKEEISSKRKGQHMGERNPNWKGDSVGYCAIHEYVSRHKPKPLECELCGEKRELELVFKDHSAGWKTLERYTRNPEDYWWACHRCHMVEEGRIEKLKEGRKRWIDGKRKEGN